jgi:hypothetical protein
MDETRRYPVQINVKVDAEILAWLQARAEAASAWAPRGRSLGHTVRSILREAMQAARAAEASKTPERATKRARKPRK